VELLAAAEEAIRRLGAGATMSELAAAAGITKPILYAHFDDKAGLAHALSLRVVSELNAVLGSGLAVDASPRDRLRATIAAFVEFVQREPQLYAFLVRGGFGDPGLVTEIGNQITIALGAALRSEGADTGPAELWSYGIIGAVFVACEWWLARPVVTADQLVEDLTTLLWSGLSPSFG
jgi:AcrR family transcriptional regulator